MKMYHACLTVSFIKIKTLRPWVRMCALFVWDAWLYLHSALKYLSINVNARTGFVAVWCGSRLAQISRDASGARWLSARTNRAALATRTKVNKPNFNAFRMRSAFAQNAWRMSLKYVWMPKKAVQGNSFDSFVRKRAVLCCVRWRSSGCGGNRRGFFHNSSGMSVMEWCQLMTCACLVVLGLWVCVYWTVLMDVLFSAVCGEDSMWIVQTALDTHLCTMHLWTDTGNIFIHLPWVDVIYYF